MLFHMWAFYPAFDVGKVREDACTKMLRWNPQKDRKTKTRAETREKNTLRKVQEKKERNKRLPSFACLCASIRKKEGNTKHVPLCAFGSSSTFRFALLLLFSAFSRRFFPFFADTSAVLFALLSTGALTHTGEGYFRVFSRHMNEEGEATGY